MRFFPLHFPLEYKPHKRGGTLPVIFITVSQLLMAVIVLLSHGAGMWLWAWLLSVLFAAPHCPHLSPPGAHHSRRAAVSQKPLAAKSTLPIVLMI